jgi:hypothetical protein
VEIEVLEKEFSVIKLNDASEIDLSKPFTFAAITDEEISLVCETQYAPSCAVACEHGWKGFRVSGELDFSLIGIIYDIARILKQEEISLFVLSTYVTDYILVKSRYLEKALRALEQSGYAIKLVDL